MGFGVDRMSKRREKLTFGAFLPPLILNVLLYRKDHFLSAQVRRLSLPKPLQSARPQRSGREREGKGLLSYKVLLRFQKPRNPGFNVTSCARRNDKERDVWVDHLQPPQEVIHIKGKGFDHISFIEDHHIGASENTYKAYRDLQVRWRSLPRSLLPDQRLRDIQGYQHSQ